MTYNEFLEENDINHLRYINFTNENKELLKITINGNPSEYINIAKEAKKLEFILVPRVESEEYYKGLLQFVQNCWDGIYIKHNFLSQANKEEFLCGEKIINAVIQEINQNWNTKQKLAYVHYKIGKLISYVPDYNYNIRTTNSPTISGTRNIWKSLFDSKSICNGIIAIEQNILSRLGIKTNELSSGVHSYLLTEAEDGNIITDATWDLTSSLYGGKPNYFGITYEELCMQEDKVSKSHRLIDPPQRVIKIDDDELREIYYSIGLIDKNRLFPLPILGKTQEINSQNYNSIEEKITSFFDMFINEFSEEAKHLCETRNILQQCLEEIGIESNSITTKFVYDKSDTQCLRPYLIIHINNENINSKIFFINTDKMMVEEIEVQSFDKQYMTHKLDTTIPFWEKYIKSKNNNNKEQNVFDVNLIK